MSEPSLWSLESVRVQERGRILGILESALQQIVSGADDLFRDPPKPGRHVIGGPVPKPGERTEADYLREEVRDLKAARDELRAALVAEQAAHSETCDLLNDMSESVTMAKKEAQEVRREALEDAAQAAETAEDPITAFKRLLCAAAIRALAPAQKGGEDARA